MPPASRVTDMQVCTTASPSPHGGGPILPPCSPDVMTNVLPQARVTDRAVCVGPLNFIVTGSTTVMVNGLMAARMTDKMMHPPPGMITLGSPNVMIGGPVGGGTLGNPTKGQAACVAARAGRTPPPGAVGPTGVQLAPNTPGQSYNNCGVESTRQIINTVNTAASPPLPTVTQEGLLTQAFANNWATQVPGNMYQSGATVPNQQVSILQGNGVPASQVAPTPENLQQAVAEHRGAVVSVWAAKLWPPVTVLANGMLPGTNTGGHAVLVTGVQYDANGNPLNYIINDTGRGVCKQSVPAAQFTGSLIGGANNHVVTNNPIW
jgi:uncharacterized Zn-binding protein involved in type VI secretion